MAKNKKTVIVGVVFLVLVAALALVWHFCNPANNTQVGAKEITVTVTHGDGSTKEFTISTDEEYLRAALESQKLISGDDNEYGLYIKTVDGETVNEANQEWWYLSKGGQMLNTGVDDTPIADGDCFELSFTVGYDF